jgi:hypothetical protein
MRKVAENCRFGLLLVAYGVMVFVATYVASQGLCFFASNRDNINLAKSDSAPSWRVHTTPNRHLRALPKMELKPFAVLADLFFPKSTRLQNLPKVEPAQRGLSFKYYRYQPRDPPAA